MGDLTELFNRHILAEMLLQIADALIEYGFLTGTNMRGGGLLMISFMPQNSQPQKQTLQKQHSFQIIPRLLFADLPNRMLQLMYQHFIDRIMQHENLRQLQRFDEPRDFMHGLYGEMQKEKLDCILTQGADSIKGVDGNDHQIARPDPIFLIFYNDPAVPMLEEDYFEVIHENTVVDQRRLFGKLTNFKNFIIKFFFDFGKCIFSDRGLDRIHSHSPHFSKLKYIITYSVLKIKVLKFLKIGVNLIL